MASRRVPGTGRLRDDATGQALVEFALTVPLFLFTMLVSLQLGLFIMMYFDVIQVTRETARWVAVYPNTTDTTIAARARELARPGMRAGAFASVTVTPSCATLVGGKCASRTASEPVTVEIRYDASHAVFLPTEFQLIGTVARIPAVLPAYRVTVMME